MFYKRPDFLINTAISFNKSFKHTGRFFVLTFVVLQICTSAEAQLVQFNPSSRNYPQKFSELTENKIITQPWIWTKSQTNGVEIVESAKTGLRTKILNYSLNFLGTRYRSSGKSPKIGFDCSGFTGFVFKKFGCYLKSSSTGQATEGKKVPITKAKTGDLAFFGRKTRKGKCYVNHAAIVISKPGEPLAIIHSASNKGIIITKIEESRYWKKSLLFVKNVL